MFAVRSAHALQPPQPSQPGPLAVHATRALPAAHVLPHPARTPRSASHGPPFDSAVRGGVQPAAELRHVQRHGHELHVQRALRACPSPPSLHSRALLPCMPPVRCRRPTSSRPRPTPRPASHAPPFDSAVRVSVQPAAELRHVQRHRHEQHVRGALRAWPIAPAAIAVGPSPRACAARALPPANALPPPGPHLALHRTPSFRLGRVRGRSTSR